MNNYIDFPNLNPVIFEYGPISLRWYGLMYLIGVLFARWLGLKRAIPLGWTKEQFDSLLFNGFIGLFLGGRIFYVLFYQFDYFIENPLYMFKVWEGGMSFHGGMVGAVIAMYISCKLYYKSFWQTADLIAPLVPFGLGAGRIGNFINDELWGRVTDVPWAIKFPSGGYLPRHPSQIYEFLLEGVLLFIILNLFIKKKRPVGSVCGLFLLLYGIFRFFVEYFREPDQQLQWLVDKMHISMGQILSLPMIFLGLIIMFFAYHNKKIRP